jgi:hypothetical protein
MAILPYQVGVVGDAQRDQVLAWCVQLWPHTRGATWYMAETGKMCMTMHGCIGRYQGWVYKFAFQREEDFLLYQITWL